MFATLKNILHKLIKKLRFSYILNSSVSPLSKIEAGSSFVHSKISDHSFCGYDCDVYHADIGKFVSIANDVVIGGGAHPLSWACTSPVFYEGRDSINQKFSRFSRSDVKRTSIGSDVWIGRGAILLSGVQVGHGSIVGAGSVVTKNIPPYEIWAGNPAKFVRNRFASDIKHALLESEWWELSDTQIKFAAHKIKDPIGFLALVNTKVKDD